MRNYQDKIDNDNKSKNAYVCKLENEIKTLKNLAEKNSFKCDKLTTLIFDKKVKFIDNETQTNRIKLRPKFDDEIYCSGLLFNTLKIKEEQYQKHSIELEEKVGDLFQQLDKLQIDYKTEKDDFLKQISSLQNVNQSLLNKLSELQGNQRVRTDQASQINVLQNQITEQIDLLNQYQHQILEHTQSIEKLHNDINEKISIITQLNIKLTKQDEIINKQNNELNDMNRKFDDIQNELITLKKTHLDDIIKKFCHVSMISPTININLSDSSIVSNNISMNEAYINTILTTKILPQFRQLYLALNDNDEKGLKEWIENANHVIKDSITNYILKNQK